MDFASLLEIDTLHILNSHMSVDYTPGELQWALPPPAKVVTGKTVKGIAFGFWVQVYVRFLPSDWGDISV